MKLWIVSYSSPNRPRVIAGAWDSEEGALEHADRLREADTNVSAHNWPCSVSVSPPVKLNTKHGAALLTRIHHEIDGH